MLSLNICLSSGAVAAFFKKTEAKESLKLQRFWVVSDTLLPTGFLLLLKAA